MDLRILLIVLVLSISWCCNARVVTTDFSPVQDGIASALQQINHQQQESEADVVEGAEAIEQICTLCKKIAGPILTFLKDTSNQQKITSTLKKICSVAVGLKDKCNAAVDLYLPAFFMQVGTMTPQTMCLAIKLCDLIPSSPQLLPENNCDSCHDLAEVLLKFKDPDVQLKAIEILLNACDDDLADLGRSPRQCKILVSISAPLILGNIERFLKSYDACSPLSCSSATNAIADVDSTS